MIPIAAFTAASAVVAAVVATAIGYDRASIVATVQGVVAEEGLHKPAIFLSLWLLAPTPRGPGAPSIL
jgi:hypothetical protein